MQVIETVIEGNLTFLTKWKWFNHTSNAYCEHKCMCMDTRTQDLLDPSLFHHIHPNAFVLTTEEVKIPAAKPVLRLFLHHKEELNWHAEDFKALKLKW